MTDTERDLLLAVAKVISSGLDTPWKDRIAMRDLVEKMRQERELKN